MGRTVWMTDERDFALRWSQWQDLGYFAVSHCKFPMSSTGWMVGCCALVERPGVGYGEESTHVTTGEVTVAGVLFVIKPASEVKKSGWTVWPGLRKPLTPPVL